MGYSPWHPKESDTTEMAEHARRTFYNERNAHFYAVW